MQWTIQPDEQGPQSDYGIDVREFHASVHFVTEGDTAPEEGEIDITPDPTIWLAEDGNRTTIVIGINVPDPWVVGLIECKPDETGEAFMDLVEMIERDYGTIVEKMVERNDTSLPLTDYLSQST